MSLSRVIGFCVLGLFLVAGQSEGGVYYVSPTGDDTHAGTISQPFRTIPRAHTAVVAGDTIYVRGGTHIYSTTISITKNGNAANRYHLFAYPGERPLLDFSSMAVADANRGINLSGSYWHVKGLDIYKAGDNGMILRGHFNIIEFCSFFENYDTGLQLSNGASNNQILNCDSYYNADLSHGNADGFAAKLDVGTGNYFYGCRAWQNSDDGYDGYLRPADNINTVMENCWIFMNGYLKSGAASSGNGNGFKLGGGDSGNADSLRHNVTLINCLAIDNRVKGYDQNNNRGSMTLYNTTAYRNGTNYSLNGPIRSTSTLTIINGVVLGTVGPIAGFAVQHTNSWMPPFVVTSSDFISIDTTGVRGPRKPDGSLPDVNFMHLAFGSDLINAGTDVGQPFNGTAPDLGCFESDWAPGASLAPLSIDFGSIYENQSKSDSVVVTNSGNLPLSVDSVRIYGGEFALVAPPPPGVGVGSSAVLQLSFNPTFAGAQNAILSVYSNAPTSPDTVVLEGTGLSTTMTVHIPYSEGWNLVSNPAVTAEDSLVALFPAAALPYAYAFQPLTGYQQQFQLLNGKGYWAKFPSGGTSPVTGTIILSDTIPVQAGWNLMGSISNPVDTNDIVWSPADARGSLYFGYCGAHTPAAVIEPGRGYWVKSNSAGYLVLVSSAAASRPVTDPVEPGGIVFTVTDASGGEQVLYLVQRDEDISMFELPPPGPEGTFDVRFETNRMAETLPAWDETVGIHIRAGQFPVNVTWEVTEGVGFFVLLVDGGARRAMGSTGTVVMTNPGQNVIRIGKESSERPGMFALQQNYPNPFNPVTQIRFSVATDARTTMTVFDLLGREVAVLYSDVAQAGREYVATFDGAQLAAGTYFYRLRSGEMNEVKKLMLVK